MGTELWVDRERAIWNVLPLRPRPEVLESLSSYITRLAEVNGIQSINELGALAGGLPIIPLKRNPDYPIAASQGLVQLTGQPQERWVDMTFSPLLQHFGCAMNPYAVHNFLAGSLGASLRYCPLCLAEHHPAYYSLLWRFLVLPGCFEHGVYFLDRFGHCGSPLPLLNRCPQLTLCPTCQGDLRTSEPSPFSGPDEAWAVLWTRDLQWFLTSKSRYEGWMQTKFLGTQFQLLRQRRALSIPEAARRLHQDRSLVRAMDSLNWSRRASLHDYICYADLLGYSLRRVFFLLV
jgi:hypothetical protein